MTPRPHRSGERKDLLTRPTTETEIEIEIESQTTAETNGAPEPAGPAPAGDNPPDSNGGGSGDSSASADQDQNQTVLLAPKGYNTPVYHAIDEDGSPHCGTAGNYETASLADAQEHARSCRICTAKSEGDPTRVCPTCGHPVPTSYWPRHVRQCDGDDADDKDNDPGRDPDRPTASPIQ